MKFPNLNPARLALAAAVLFAAAPGQSQILLKVDSTKAWQGYMNVFNLPDYSGGYLWGSAWGIADLRAIFTGTTTLTLLPNTNVYNPADPYWVNPDGSGNKFMEANFYVENTSLRGHTVTFAGTVLEHTLVGGTSNHLTRAFVKVLDSGSGYIMVAGQFLDLTNSATPYPFSITVDVPPGATMIPQYGFVTTGPDVNPVWAATNGHVRIAVDNSDPSITGQPANQRVQVGGNASFTVTATGGSPLSYQWKRYGTNLVDGGNVSGATNATLTLTNVQLDDMATYSATVTDAAGSADSDPATLRVKTAAEFANALDNPGFEEPLVDPVTLIPTPWNTFAGASYRSTNDFYAFDPNYPVQAHDGTNVCYSYNAGEWNGVFQDVPAAPGDIFTADAWFYLSSQEQLFGDITASLEVQFRDGGAVLEMYRSVNISNTTPMDTWFSLPATNGFEGDFVTPIANARYLVAPPGTTTVRYQVTIHALAGSLGSVDFDSTQLMRKIPVQVSASAGGGQITLSWMSQAATSYQVMYKDNVIDAVWTPIAVPAPGDGTRVSTSFPASGAQRYYAVLTL